MAAATTDFVQRHGETRRRGARDDPDPLAELGDPPELPSQRVRRNHHGVGVLDGALEHRPVPADGGLRPLAGCSPRTEIPNCHDGLIVLMHAIVLHEGREQRRRVDHAATDTGADTELQCGRELATREGGAADADEPRDLHRTPGRRDRLDVTACGRSGDQSPG